jgi:hypothetical protein
MPYLRSEQAEVPEEYSLGYEAEEDSDQHAAKPMGFPDAYWDER